MHASAKAASAPTQSATITSKGQITVPIQIRRSLGVRPGDKLRFEPQKDGYRVVRDTQEDVFEKWRGIGTGFQIPGKGRDAIVAFFREMRGHVNFD